jgi:hypothetical protein
VKLNNIRGKLTQYGSSNKYLLSKRTLKVNAFFDSFSVYYSLAQDDQRRAGPIDDGGTYSAAARFLLAKEKIVMNLNIWYHVIQ